ARVSVVVEGNEKEHAHGNSNNNNTPVNNNSNNIDRNHANVATISNSARNGNGVNHNYSPRGSAHVSSIPQPPLTPRALAEQQQQQQQYAEVAIDNNNNNNGHQPSPKARSHNNSPNNNATNNNNNLLSNSPSPNWFGSNAVLMNHSNSNVVEN